MDQHETTTPTERKPLGRRTVLKGAAWSVPAVVAVGATPAFAATGGTEVPIIENVTLTGTRGSNNTKKNVDFVWDFTSNVAITGVLVSTNQPAGMSIGTVAAPTPIDGAAQATFRGDTGANTTQVPTFTLTVSFTHDAVTETATFTVTRANAPENTPTTFTVTPLAGNPTVII